MEGNKPEFDCCICGKHIQGEFGNNPWPIYEMSLECCDECNRNVVIPARERWRPEDGDGPTNSK